MNFCLRCLGTFSVDGGNGLNGQRLRETRSAETSKLQVLLKLFGRTAVLATHKTPSPDSMNSNRQQKSHQKVAFYKKKSAYKSSYFRFLMSLPNIIVGAQERTRTSTELPAST